VNVIPLVVARVVIASLGLLTGAPASARPAAAPPAPPRRVPLSLSVAPRRVGAGQRVTITVRTAGHAYIVAQAEVTGALVTVTFHAGHWARVTRIRVLYHAKLQGAADARGLFVGRLLIAYKTSKPVQARLRVVVRAMRGTQAAEARFTILPRLTAPLRTASPAPTATTTSATASPAPTATTTPLPSSAGDPVIAGAGNIACDPTDPQFNGGNGSAYACHMRATSDLLAGASLAAVFTLGDNQYESGTLAQYQQVYDPTWGRVKGITHPAIGNREYLTSGAAGYFDYFGAAAGDQQKAYYSYDIGAWHIVVLNSECAQVGGCGVGSSQEQWLHADLAAHPTRCTLAYWHEPRFSSGTSGDNAAYDAFWRDLYRAGADVVLNGHDHDYERFAPQDPNGNPDGARGMREFIVGTGGESHASFNTIQPNSEVRNNNTFGVLELTLHPSSYDWRFVPQAGESFTDSGSGSCH